MLDDILIVLAHMMGDMPPGAGWLAPAAIMLLGAAATVDARTARVPDALVFFGLLLVTVVRGLYVDWQFSANHLSIGLAAGFAIYAINLVWYRFRKRDALGMGDAKWTILAVDAFGIMPGLIAWIVGAWLALLWMGAARLRHRPINHVYFAPFLFGGLLVGIYVMRFR